MAGVDMETEGEGPVVDPELEGEELLPEPELEGGDESEDDYPEDEDGG
jgi:hypothetical protein